ncbi:MAG: fibronectin type III domain-containing protein [Candidatus Glassbacteria bacterium]|nr:fibronectin type III domain-containing protein [Candidatus Glassbacteria bacterium]
MRSNMPFAVLICSLTSALCLSFPDRVALGSDNTGSSDPAADVRPAPPRNLSAIQQDRRVLLRWEAPEPANEITTYRIYRLRGSNDSFLPMATCPAGQLSYLVEKLEPGSTYYFAVTSETGSGLESDSLSPVIQVKEAQNGKLEIKRTLETGTGWDNIPPEAPGNFSGRIVAPGKYLLEWSASQSADVLYYQLYYSATSPPPIGPENLIAKLRQGAVSFLHIRTPKVGGAHYAVIAVDRQDNLSRPALYSEQ